MKVIFFSSVIDTIDEWKKNHNIQDSVSCYDIETLYIEINKYDSYLIIVDYDSVASELNKLIATNKLPQNIIVLERAPEIATGKILISRGIKAYGNSRMFTIHFLQMIGAVIDEKVWTYPELTAALTKQTATTVLNDDSITLIQNRLSPKEIEVIYYVLDGLTNDAISSKLNITTRTVKAHVSSIFSKLHVSDRISLMLLLK